MGDLEQLQEFGFSDKAAKRALRKTRNAGLQPALDWLQDHENDAEDDSGDEDDDAQAQAGPSIPQPTGEAKSLKCLDCGKVFRTVDEASYHGDKSGHANFEESTEEKKPLTEEEKAAKLQELREKAAQRKADKAKLEAEEFKKNEAIRRKGGKEINQIKEDMKLKEAQKEAEARKREKMEDIKARQRIKAQIEADKRERAEKTAREKAIRDGTPLPTNGEDMKSGPRPPASNAPIAGASKKAETRLQIRLPAGTPLTTTAKSEDTLQSVLDWTLQNNAMNLSLEGKISIPFPRKTFTQAEMGKTLLELGLVPSSVLIIN